MTNKILTIALVLTACMFVLNGCGVQSTESYNPTIAEENKSLTQITQNALHDTVADDQFERITISTGNTTFTANNFVLFRDKYTDIVYIAMRGKYDYQLSPMLKPDGSPMLYSEWVELYRGKAIEEIMIEPTEEVVTETLPEVTEEYTEPTEETYAADYSIDLDEWEE